MITNGLIAYTEVPNPLFFWEPAHSTLNTLLLGFLTTLLSFQATALVFDFCLGFKSKGQASISDMHSLMLTRASSPIAVLNNVMRKDWLTRLYYNGDIPRGTKINRDQTPIELKTVGKVLLLFAIGPIINMAAVASTLESEKYLTFRESGFGGLGFGVNMNLNVAESHLVTETCKHYNISTVFQDSAMVEFSSCNLPFIIMETSEVLDFGLIAVGVTKQSEVFVQVELHGWLVAAATKPQLYANETLFEVRHALNDTSAAVLVDLGIDFVAAECGLENTSIADEVTIPSSKQTQTEYIHAKEFPCRRNGPVSEDGEEELRTSQDIGKRLRNYMTFVDTDRLDLYVDKGQNEEVPFIESSLVDNILFLRRRRRNLSVPILSLVPAILIAIRILSISFLNNDVALAIELVVKKRLGMDFYESMLQDRKADVSYNNKFQKGERAQYGLIIFDLPRVDRFEGGILGADLEG